MTDILDRLRAVCTVMGEQLATCESSLPVEVCDTIMATCRDAIAALEQRDAEIARLKAALAASDARLTSEIQASQRQLRETTEPMRQEIAQLREAVRLADSYLSLLWHRYTKREARDDTTLAYEVDRAIGIIRSAAALAAQREETP